MQLARRIDCEALCLLMERATDGSPLKKRREIDKVRKAYRRGELFIPPNETETQRWWRCEARMMLGDYSDWTGWEYRDDWAATLWHWRDTKPYDVPPWNGVRTPCLYVIGEQGIGDEVFFASCLPEAIKRADRVILECVPRLRSLFERSFGIETIPSDLKDGKRYKRELPVDVTAWVALADLPRMFRGDLSHFSGKPYLKADIEQIRRFDDYRGRTGVSWRGAQGQEKGLIEPGMLSLQYDQAWDEDVDQPQGLDLKNDIEGLLGLLSNLERVVTVSTSVAHFACALGVKTDVVIADPKTGVRGNIFPWKWVCRRTPNRTPWYGCATVYQNLRDYRARPVA